MAPHPSTPPLLFKKHSDMAPSESLRGVLEQVPELHPRVSDPTGLSRA